MRHVSSAAPAAALVLCLALGCAGAPPADGPRIELNTSGAAATVDVVGLPAGALQALGEPRTREEWAQVFRVAVEGEQTPMIGRHEVDGGRLRFVPMFPLDPGRVYEATFAWPEAGPAISARVALPARDTTPTTSVSAVYPTADVLPENQLRLYVHFSAPMGLKGGLDYIHLLDEDGREVVDPFLPLDTEFWNDDRTRYTVFFDPGRQKRGIAPIAEMGRSLTAGRAYTLVVDAAWRDGDDKALTGPYRRTFRVGPPDERPLDHLTWQVKVPRARTADPLVVLFGEPLDHGLLLRALGVTGPGGTAVAGDVAVGQGEERWTFTPREPWAAGEHQLVAFAMLEDLAGNRIGRAFEVDQFDRADRTPEPEKTRLPFNVRP